MYDINQIIANDGSPPADEFLELENWSEEFALRMAEEENIALSPEHWGVVHFLRDHYRRCGPCPSGRTVLALLEEKYAKEGGRKYLYHLFPHGPVVQAYKIAGLPLPAYSSDASFGSVM